MIVGLGLDIVRIERITELLRRHPQFAKRVLTTLEWDEFLNHRFAERYLAKRFAAKEAAAKALGTGIAQGVSFQDFTVTHTALGKPSLSFSGEADQLRSDKGITHIHLSITDENNYAAATVILEALS